MDPAETVVIWTVIGLGGWLLTVLGLIAVTHVGQRKHWPPEREEKNDGDES